MRSQVTRHVLRRLLATRASAVSPLGAGLSRPTFRTYPVGCRVARAHQRRTFFHLFQKPPRTLKEPEIEPGYQTLLRCAAAINDNVRPPPTPELVQAWCDFFGYKTQYGRVVNSSQANCALQVLLYLRRSEAADDVQLSADDLRLARDCLSKPPRGNADDHLELSRALYQEIRRKALAIQARPFHDVTPKVKMMDLEAPGYARDFYSLLSALAQYGRALEAKDMLMGYWKKLRTGSLTTIRSQQMWMPVMRGLAKEGHEKELLKLISQAEEAGVEFDPPIHGVISVFFAQRDNVAETKFWFNRPISKELPPAPSTYYEILKFALRNDQREWAASVFQNLVSRLESGPLRGHKSCWDISYQWAVLLLGKGNDHLEHMFRVAQERTQDKPVNCRPNIGSINGLLKIAIEKKDPYMAERFVSLSKKLGFKPDFKTYVLQMEYRILAGDLEGAHTAYQALRRLDETYKDREMAILNHFIRALCEAPKPNYERVLKVISYLEERRVTLEPETVACVCMTFLRNDESYEVIDTLSLHTVDYSLDERLMVCKAFVDYCLDEKNSTARIWDAYTLLRQFFPELEVEDRLRIMDTFFSRRRPDMACHIFGHMRSHSHPSFHPDEEVYVRYLEGIGRSPDLESLKTVHNMLKMDTTVQPNTLLYNSLMIGYIACGASRRALEFWTEITRSPEGPSYATLEIVFRAYQVTHRGDKLTRELWEKIQRMDIEVPVKVYTAYVTSLAAHGHLEDVKVILDDMQDNVGIRPDLNTLAYVYNALPLRKMRADFEAWADHEYCSTWETLKKNYRRREDGLGVTKFKIARPWKA